MNNITTKYSNETSSQSSGSHGIGMSYALYDRM